MSGSRFVRHTRTVTPTPTQWSRLSGRWFLDAFFLLWTPAQVDFRRWERRMLVANRLQMSCVRSAFNLLTAFPLAALLLFCQKGFALICSSCGSVLYVVDVLVVWNVIACRHAISEPIINAFGVHVKHTHGNTHTNMHTYTHTRIHSYAYLCM